MTYGISQNGQDTPPSQEFATAIPANSAIPANEQEPVSFEQYKDKAVLPEAADSWPDPQPLENRETSEPYPVNA